MQIALPDGRTLVYAEYGDPNGRPIFFFHGIPGSRIFRPPDEITALRHVRLICIDRPGSGLSTYQQNRKILDWPKDVAALADHLGMDRFAVIGHSGGGPYVAASAYSIPERITSATIVSGVGPLDALDATKGMHATNKAGFETGRWLPWPLWRLAFWLYYRKIFKQPELLVRAAEERRSHTPPADLEILRRPGVLALFRQSMSEGFRQGTLAHAHEARLLARPWGFSLTAIQVPCYLWHGTEDAEAPISMGRYVASQIPNCRATFCKGEGHMLLFNHWEEILGELAG